MSSQPGYEVLCVGRLYCDMVFSGLEGLPVLGQECFADGIKIGPGGGAYITAAYMAAMGWDVALGAVLPAAPFRDAVMTEMAASGINLTPCAPARPGDDPQVTVGMVAQGDRAFLTRRVGAAVPVGTLQAMARPGLKHLHIGELTTLLEHPELITQARARGLTISLDCAWDAAALARDDLADVIRTVDVFLPNAEEAQALGPVLAAMPDVTVVVKEGARGAHCGGTRRAAQSVQAVDTTGAGDAFNAGFLSVWLVGGDIDAALEAGVAAGAVAVTLPGGASAVPDLRTSRCARSLKSAHSA